MLFAFLFLLLHLQPFHAQRGQIVSIPVLFVLGLDYEDKALEKPLKLVLKVGGSEVTELSGSGHDSSYYDDRSDHERERHREKKKKKKKKSEKDKDKYVDDEERRRRKVCWEESAGFSALWTVLVIFANKYIFLN